MNVAFLIGRVGKDPEVKETPNGGKIARYSVATTNKYKDKAGERKEETTWHNCVSFGKQAEVVAKYVEKGMLVSIQGRIENRTTGEGKERKYFSSIAVANIEFLSKGKGKSESDDGDPGPEDKAFNADDAMGDDDLPF